MIFLSSIKGRRGRMIVRVTTTVQSVPITTKFVSLNPAHNMRGVIVTTL